MITVKHSGNIGDIVYGLPAIKHMCDIFNEPIFYYLDIKSLGLNLCGLSSLLEHQYYIKGTKTYDGEKVDYDLDLFRNTSGLHNLAERHLIPFGFPLELIDQQSLFIDNNLFNFPRYNVVINRTKRYLNEDFPWKHLLEKEYKDSSKCFIGHKNEYNIFMNMFHFKNQIDFLETKDLLEAAWVIKQSDIFIGNCSSPYAIAEGMKHKTIQETNKSLINCCLFNNPNAKYFINKFATFDEVKKEYLT